MQNHRLFGSEHRAGSDSEQERVANLARGAGHSDFNRSRFHAQTSRILPAGIKHKTGGQGANLRFKWEKTKAPTQIPASKTMTTGVYSLNRTTTNWGSATG